MSNYLAIATVTATLQRILQQAIQSDVEGASVTTSRPETSGGLPETAVNLYLYHIKRNSALGQSEHPARQRRNLSVKRNQIGIDLFYVITFYGDESELEPQRLMGATLRTLEDNNVLSSELIRETISDPAYGFIANSDLANQLEMIRTEFLSISTDELSKIWSVFFQTPYTLSVVYKVTVLTIEGEEPAQVAIPVRNREFNVLRTKLEMQPVIQQVLAVTGRYQPILRDTTITIKGKKFGKQGTRIRICGELVNPSLLKDTEAHVSLASLSEEVLRAGVQGIQIVRVSDSRDRNISALESNVFPFVLRPTITETSLEDIDGFDDDPRSGEINVTLDLQVSPRQRVVLLLNMYSTESTQSYLFKAEEREEDTNTIKFGFQGVEAGEYLVRVQIDGAESIIDDETSAENITPRLTIN